MNGMVLARLPASAKLFCTLYLLGTGCGALAAFAQAATAVGLSPTEGRTARSAVVRRAAVLYDVALKPA